MTPNMKRFQKGLLTLSIFISPLAAWADRYGRDDESGTSSGGAGNFLAAIAAIVGSCFWMFRAVVAWQERQTKGIKPERFQGASDAIYCFIGWAIMAALVSIGPALLVRAFSSARDARELWVYIFGVTFAAIVYLKRT